ncbi:MAG: hypothetical protein E3J72_20405 [Planctomycetota bacterium]|nr:MAG: hypothetical protein E3J72_20405 [Planctomycetota bacterium]
MKKLIIPVFFLFSLPAGCAGVTSLPDYSRPAQVFLKQYLGLASMPGGENLYFSGRDKWKRRHDLDRSRLAELVKDDPEGARAAFDAVLGAAETGWRNMEYYLRRSLKNSGQAAKYQRASIADFMVAHDIVTAIADASGEESAAPLKKRFRKLARRLDPK